MENENMVEEIVGGHTEPRYEEAKASEATPVETTTPTAEAHISRLAALEAWVKGEFLKLRAEFTKDKSEL